MTDKAAHEVPHAGLPPVLHTYSGCIARKDLENGRRFLSDWLDTDNHGFRIPGGKWGRELVEVLNSMLAATQKVFTINEHDGVEGDLDALIEQAVRAERDRQVAIGYNQKHDDEHPLVHLENWAEHYRRKGEFIKALALWRAFDESQKRRIQRIGRWGL